jgi:two-component system, OmpR family, sensor histidine kinase BaeS
MNRLATRLVLATLTVALIALAAVPVATHLADQAVLATLPDGVRLRLYAVTPTAWVVRWWERPLRRAPHRPLHPGLMAGSDPIADVDALLGALADSRAARRDATLLAIAVAVLAGVALATTLARAIARPIAAVSDATSRLAAGEFGTRVTLDHPHRHPRETRELAEGFNAMSAAIERYESERSAMIADVAHELRTPLAAMRLRLEAIHDGIVPLTPDEITLLGRHTDLLARLVDDLRLLSQADAGRLPLALASVDASAWLRDAVAAARDALDRAGIAIAVAPPPHDTRVVIDPQRFTQILHNLLDNAARFAPAGSTVDVTLRLDGATFALIVRDRGPGIDAGNLATIFERFTQGRRRDLRGSGLGLAIVRTLAALHGGDATARNLPADQGGGAEFTVAIPRLHPHETHT